MLTTKQAGFLFHEKEFGRYKSDYAIVGNLFPGLFVGIFQPEARLGEFDTVQEYLFSIQLYDRVKLAVMMVENMDTVMKEGIAVPTSLDALDAAVLVYLVDLFGEKARERRSVVTDGALVVYKLVDRPVWAGSLLGGVGELWLRKVKAKTSNLRATAPPVPSEEDTLIYLAGWSFFSQDPSQNLIQAKQELREKIIQTFTASDQSFDPWFQEGAIDRVMKVEILNAADQLHQKRLAELHRLIQEIMGRLQYDGLWKPAQPAHLHSSEKPDLPGQPGNPGLSDKEQVYRLAMAIWAEEIRDQDASKPWKEIARQIRWPYSLKLLEDARRRLERAEEKDRELYVAAYQMMEQLKHKF